MEEYPQKRSLILNVVGQVDAGPVREIDLATKFTKKHFKT
jgi:hypothetical protein